MPIYVYQGNKQISTNAIRNNKVVKVIYVKEQGQDAVCVWGYSDLLIFTYRVLSNEHIVITGVREGLKWERITIPKTINGRPVTSIDSYAFRNNTLFNYIELSDSLDFLGSYAFEGCNNLTQITIPKNIITVGGNCFKDCSSLTTVNWLATACTSAGKPVPGSSSKPIFKGCSNLATVNIGDNVTTITPYTFFGCTGLTSITIPDSVMSIGTEAFYNCTGLTSITIGKGVTSIGSYAVYGCAGLTSITFNGTIAQWNAISKGSSWNSNTGNYTIHCTDGDIPKS